MKITNNANLPAPLVSALLYDRYDYDKAGDISTTAAIMPPRLRQLLKRHRDEITEDISERIWRVVGDVGHGIIERAGDDNVFREERLTLRLHGWLVTGKVDLMFNTKEETYAIDDYKFTSVWAAKDAKPEWEAQLNIYALLARANNFDVKQLRIINILRDWSKSRAGREPEYPQAGVVVREVPVWTEEKQAAYLSERVLAHQNAEKLADDDLPLCTDQERWKKPDVWAVKKKGNKRAQKLFETEHDAVEMLRGFTDLIVEKRPGSYPRCESYCAVKQFCSFGRTLTPAASEEAA